MKIISLFVFSFMILFLSGCNFKDIEKKIFVIAIGIDQSDEEDKPYRVTLKLALPVQKFEIKENNTQVVTMNSETITGAIDLISAKLSKELNFGDAEISILGEGIAIKNIEEPLDWLLRRSDIPSSGLVALGKPNAEAVLRMVPKAENFPGNSLTLNLAEEGSRSAYTLSVYLYDFYRRITEKGLDPYLPVVEPDKEVYNINTVALLDKQKVKTFLSPLETSLFKELLRKYPYFNISTPIDHQTLVLGINRFERDYSIDTSNSNAPVVGVSINMIGAAEETSKPIYEEDWSQIEAAIENEERVQFTSLLKKLQKNGLDPLGFGLLYRATHHGREQDWEEWQALYPKAKFDVQVKMKLKGTGAIK